MTTVDVACICQDEEEVIGWMLRACEALLPNLENVVIVDGGSRDNTLDVIASWRDRLPIRLFRHPFDNFAAQKNRALEHCTADWIVLADADMTWGSNLVWELERTDINQLDKATCIDVPLFYTVIDAHHYRNDLEIGGSVRIVRNVGCRYVQPVHEYLVWPGEEDPKDIEVIYEFPKRRPDWESINSSPRLRAYGQIPFFEHTWRKSDEGLRNKVRRYRQFASKSARAGVFMDPMADDDYLVRERDRILKEGLYAPLPPGRDRFVIGGT